jgi:uncharacterized metal-binding protein
MSLFDTGIRISDEIFAHTGSKEAAIESLERTCDICVERYPGRKCHGCQIESKIDEFKRPRLVLVKPQVAATSEKKRIIRKTKVKENVYFIIGGHRWLKYTR